MPKPLPNFIPECYVDTLLLKVLEIPRNLLNHANNNSKVAKAMESQIALFHLPLIGLVDNDRKQPPYFKDFVLNNEKSKNNILFKHKPNTKHYLILLNPEFEEWILNCAIEAKVKPKDFNLPDTAKELHRITGKINIEKNNDFIKFLKAIKRKNPPSFKTLQNFIHQFTNESKEIT